MLRPRDGLLDNDCSVKGNPFRHFHDSYHGFVVRAVSAAAARQVAARAHGDEGPIAWLEAQWSSCEQLLEVGVEEVVIGDYFRG